MLDLRLATIARLISRAKRGVCLLICAIAPFLAASNSAQNSPSRPRILGIAGVTIYSSDIPAAHSFYSKVLGRVRVCDWCETPPGRSFLFSNLQRITLSSVPSPAPTDLLAEVVFATDDVPALKRYLNAHGISVSQPDKQNGNYVKLTDPEGHVIAFTNNPKLSSDALVRLSKAIPYEPHIIHAGFIVNDRSATDHFYKDILGFRPYWHGGMKDDQDSWVAMQVPDGTDWIEYMLNISPAADHHTIGVMNHIALGVTDIQAAKASFIENGGTPGEEPKLGRDGKWQLNLYDPDETRVEFMEFTPKEKPCCSEFTGPHPGPQK